MSRTYNVIDSDGHVLEPPDFWRAYIDPRYRDRAPELFVDTDGRERLRVEGKVLGGPTGLGLVGAIGARQGEASIKIKYTEGRKGGFDPHARIPDMELDGIDAVFLYPSLGLFSGAVEDPQLAAAMCRAYNRWLAVAPSSASRWKQALARGGQQAVRAKPHPGSRSRLSAQQKTRLLRELAKGPRAAGYPTELWTCPRVADLIARRFGVHYHPAYVWPLLRQLLWSPQKPAHRARERDEAASARWRTQTWPGLKKSAAA